MTAHRMNPDTHTCMACGLTAAVIVDGGEAKLCRAPDNISRLDDLLQRVKRHDTDAEPNAWTALDHMKELIEIVRDIAKRVT